MTSTTTPPRADDPAAPGRRAASRAAGSAPPGGRVAGVDVVRGLLLVVSVVSSSLLAPPEWYDHAAWTGVHPVDLVFPSFVVLTGAGLGFAHKNGVRVGRLVRRVLVLVLAGLAYNAALEWVYSGDVDLGGLRWTGVLQLYAGIVLVVALLHLVVRGWVGWLLVALGLAAAHTALLARWAAGCPGGELTPRCNPSLTLDGALLPVDRLFEWLDAGHDPEGVVALLGACATAAAGTAVAKALIAARQRSASPAAALPRLLVVAAALAAGAAASSPFVPAMKRLWTAPFGLGVAAGVVLVVAVVHVLVDAPWTSGASTAARRVRGAREPFVALGRNSLLVYFGSHVVAALLEVRPFRDDPSAAPSHAERLGSALAWLGGTQVGFSALLLAAWGGVAVLLHRRGWYLRA